MKLLYEQDFDIVPQAQERARVRVVQKKGSKPFAIVYDPERSKKFKKDLIALILTRLPKEILCQPLILSCKIFITRPKSVTREYPEVKPGLSNYVKGVEDAMNKLVYTDDSKIIGYTECWKFYREHPGISVKLYSL
jgi:Holliday junction resolvase RusA-like endonuclease